jgi:peptidoglycan/xylan/chitin deacetylase (PgdA/CDA1 family)
MRLKALCLLFTLISCTESLAELPEATRRCTRPGLFAFTFDDGVTKNYPELLNVLDAAGIKAAMFIEGQVSADRARLPLLIEAHKRGHEIGNHTWTHPHLTKMNMTQWDTEIGNTERLIDSVTWQARKHRFMRPPHGEYNEALQSYLRLKGNEVVLWNIELTGDWRKGKRARSRAQLWSSFIHAFMKADPAKDSFILLQHDKSLASIHLIPDVATMVRNRGFRIVPLSECLRLDK